MVPKHCKTLWGSLSSPRKYPWATVSWTRDADEMGVSGSMTIWVKEGERAQGHTIDIRQSAPLGGLFITFDGFTYGAWTSADIPVEGLTERDLHWATAWAVQAWKHKTEVFGESKPEEVEGG